MKKTFFSLFLVLTIILLPSCASTKSPSDQSKATSTNEITTQEPTDPLSVAFKQIKQFAKAYTSSDAAAATYKELVPQLENYNIAATLIIFSEDDEQNGTEELDHCFPADSPNKPTADDVFANGYIKKLALKNKDKYTVMSDEEMANMLFDEGIEYEGKSVFQENIEFKTDKFKFKGYLFGIRKLTVLGSDGYITVCVVAYEPVG